MAPEHKPPGRPALTRSTASKELMNKNGLRESKDWNDRRSSLQKQSYQEFADGKCLTKSWVNDDLSELKEKLRERQEEEEPACAGLSHIYSLDGSIGGSMGGVVKSKGEA